MGEEYSDIPTPALPLDNLMSWNQKFLIRILFTFHWLKWGCQPLGVERIGKQVPGKRLWDGYDQLKPDMIHTPSLRMLLP